MHVYEVTPGIYKIFSQIASLKTYSTGYLSKQQNETGYFCRMTLLLALRWTKVPLYFMAFEHPVVTSWNIDMHCALLQISQIWLTFFTSAFRDYELDNANILVDV